MKRLLLPIIMIVFTSSCTHIHADQSADKNNRIPQATPVHEFYLATFNSDLDRFRAVFSDEAALPPDKIISEYFILFRKFYGDEIALSDLDEFSYSYEGDRSRGSVIINFAGSTGRHHVVKDGSRWKLAKYSPAPDDRNTKRKHPIPQAKPVIEYIQATKMGDLKGLKDSLAEHRNWTPTDEEILNSMKHIRFDLIEQYGFLYDPNDFDYAYKGNDSKGRLDWIFPNGKSESFQVIKENDVWKLD